MTVFCLFVCLFVVAFAGNKFDYLLLEYAGVKFSIFKMLVSSVDD